MQSGPKHNILVINPGSTSTKVAVFADAQCIWQETLRHKPYQLSAFQNIADQFPFRKKIILESLQEKGFSLRDFSMIMGRGGLVKPIPSGVYLINEALLRDLRAGVSGQHASNLGGLLAHDIAAESGCAMACIADPVVVDEMDDIARVSGHPLFVRKSIFHALNQKAVARLYAHDTGQDYEALRLIVAHIGGGITVGAHRNGRVVDVNQGLDGEGPFSPERSGTLPLGDVVRMCYSGQYSLRQMLSMITGQGGLVAYLATNDTREVEAMAVNGNTKAKLIYEAMAYQVAKDIGAMSAVLCGKTDAILLTGGVVHSQRFTAMISERVAHLAPIHVYPGEDEMEALAMNGLKVLQGVIIPADYQ